MTFGGILDPRGWSALIAELHVRAGRFDDAEAIYRRILARHPRRAVALNGLGRLLLRERRFEEAVEVWQRAVEIAPDRTGPAFQLARALHRSGRLDDAAARYLSVLALDPSHEKAIEAVEQISLRLSRLNRDGAAAIDGATMLAERLAALGPGSGRTRDRALTLLANLRSRTDPETAIAFWQQRAVQNKRAIEPPLHMARIRRRQRRSDEARHLFGLVLQVDPGHAEALTGYGQALADTDPAAAIRHFTAWADRKARDVAPRFELAQLYQQTRDWTRAEAMFREILDRVPDDRNALARFAQLLSRNPSRLEQALELWDRIALRDASAPFPLVQRAYLLQRADRLDGAEAAYRDALARAPADAMALVGLARLLFDQRRWQEAAVYFDTLHRVDGRRADALLSLGRSLERLDRPQEALAAYQKVLAMDPTDANAQLYRGRLLRRLGRTEEAIEAWRQVAVRSPQNADAWHELVFILASAERDAEALAVLGEAESALPATPAAWAKLGLAAQAGQFHERAVHYFEQAIASAPDDAAHHARLGQHYHRRGIADGAFHHLLASRELKPDDVAVTRQLVDTVRALNVVGINHIDLADGPRRYGEVLMPERLFPLVRGVADARSAPYDPVPRRIIAVTSSLAAGGAERQLVNLLRGLDDPALGLDLTLFCISLARQTHRDFFLPQLSGCAVEIVTPPTESESWREETGPFARLIRAFPADMAGPIAFWTSEFARRRPSVVHAWQDGTNLTAVVAALLAGVPRIVLGARSVRPDNPRRRLKRFMREAYQAVLGHQSVILTNNSQAGADDYADWLGIARSSIQVIPNGIDFDQFLLTADPARTQALRTSLGIPHDAPVIGSAFRMSEEKRPLLWVDVAAEVARSMPHAHFIVHGDGPLRADMASRAASLGIADRLHLPGPVDSMASSYRAMDLVMLTSRHEGLPNVLLEAQSLGVPVLAPDVGGMAETVHQGITGWCIGNADAQSLAQQAISCLMDSQWMARAGAEAPAFVRSRFGIQAMIRRTVEVYGITAP